jgi:hypothetical protein
MRPAAFVVLIVLFDSCSVARAECLSSADAVWAAHPGSHATWRLRLPGHEGVKCWFAAGRGKAMDAAAARDSIPENNANAIPLPLPRPGSTDALTGADRVSSPGVSTGEARSVLTGGTPMQIDQTWDDLFIARELHAR